MASVSVAVLDAGETEMGMTVILRHVPWISALLRNVNKCSLIKGYVVL